MPKVTAMLTESMINEQTLCRLMTWLSPSFPVGAFAYSHALEHAVDQGQIHDCQTLTQWVEGILTFGAGKVDASLFRNAYEAEQAQDDARLAAIVERATAQRGTREMALESAAQGRAYLDTLCKTWPQPRLTKWQGDLTQTGQDPAYAVAVAVSCTLAQIPLRPALAAYLHAFSANLISAVVRLVPLGQTDGQRAIAGLEAGIVEAAASAMQRPSDDFTSAALSIDWHSMQHETQYTRLFRS